MSEAASKNPSVNQLGISLERDGFCRTIINELSGLLQDMIGLEEAEGFISIVGQNIGNSINDEYRKALGVNRLDHDQIADVLLDLKARINGGFYIIEKTSDKIVFGNSQCPFEEKVKDRPSLCMMTSNVFGTIAAENNDYAKVTLDETIASGCDKCTVTVFLKDTEECASREGREYFKDE